MSYREELLDDIELCAKYAKDIDAHDEAVAASDRVLEWVRKSRTANTIIEEVQRRRKNPQPRKEPPPWPPTNPSQTKK